ncbi:thiol-disulfide oxidoreductase DCC family protein [Archangium violaceum]|uniref:thiol-disulfide oxidoreductase DCC family protein n=1 Tax=Archangium violaceum TaxID=83451 RepID=UPI00193B2A94|nr:thiol-disulfide oxidoreductase DCC family protein [Archangium violaceum]QRK11617.1 thiol-disulfide oxidoreductase DCC family protein [Archangium violaceum]
MSEAKKGPGQDTPVVLFDGVCNLCNGVVNFIIDRDPSARFRFAALQSTQAAVLLAPLGRVPEADPQSFILVEDGRVYERSSAALRVARKLPGAWKLFYVFVVVPTPLRDAVYRFIARNRYRWFGKADACRMPTPELRARFL